MPTLVATNIRLPAELLKALKYKAIEETKSVNQLIREAVETSLFSSIKPGKTNKDAIEDIIGRAESGIKNGSINHDQYLYGKKK